MVEICKNPKILAYCWINSIASNMASTQTFCDSMWLCCFHLDPNITNSFPSLVVQLLLCNFCEDSMSVNPLVWHSYQTERRDKRTK